MKNTVDEFFNDKSFDDYIPEESFKTYSIDIECEVRQLRAEWTRIAPSEFNISIDAEDELIKILQAEIYKVTNNSVYGTFGLGPR